MTIDPTWLAAVEAAREKRRARRLTVAVLGVYVSAAGFMFSAIAHVEHPHWHHGLVKAVLLVAVAVMVGCALALSRAADGPPEDD